MLILMLSAAPDEGELASFKLIGPCIVPKSNNNNDNSNNSHIMIVKRLWYYGCNIMIIVITITVVTIALFTTCTDSMLTITQQTARSLARSLSAAPDV